MGEQGVTEATMGYGIGRHYDGQRGCYRIKERSEAGLGQSYIVGTMGYR